MSENDVSVDNTRGLNIIPFAAMAGGWLAPLFMFWLYVWGPLRPFDYPRGDLAPSLLPFVGALLASIALWWTPQVWFRVHRFEETGTIYRRLGVRLFRHFVPDGDFANRWRRRDQPSFRMINGRNALAPFITRTEASERGHLVLLAAGFASSLFALSIGWNGWALYLALGNVLVNVYPILLQRYTRARLRRAIDHRRVHDHVKNCSES